MVMVGGGSRRNCGSRAAGRRHKLLALACAVYAAAILCGGCFLRPCYSARCDFARPLVCALAV